MAKPIRRAMIDTLPADLSLLLPLSDTYRECGIRTLDELESASPATVQKLSKGRLNGEAIELSTFILRRHHRATRNLKEKPPPKRRKRKGAP